MGSDHRPGDLSSRNLYFNPRSPHGERLCSVSSALEALDFNPRSPHGERLLHSARPPVVVIFQSTLPAWGATPRPRRIRRGCQYFNPRSPHGERPPCLARHMTSSQFQSTLPAWGATKEDAIQKFAEKISIHAPRMGSDTVEEALTLFGEISIHAPRMGSDTCRLYRS